MYLGELEHDAGAFLTVHDDAASPWVGIGSSAGSKDVDFQFVADSIPHIVWMAPRDGAGYLNRHGRVYAGISAEGSSSWDWLSLVHPDDFDAARVAWEGLTRAGTEYRLDYPIRRFDGVYRWHTVRGLPVVDA